MKKQKPGEYRMDVILDDLEAGTEEYDDRNYTSRLYGIISGIEEHGADGYVVLLEQQASDAADEDERKTVLRMLRIAEVLRRQLKNDEIRIAGGRLEYL